MGEQAICICVPQTVLRGKHSHIWISVALFYVICGSYLLQVGHFVKDGPSLTDMQLRCLPGAALVRLWWTIVEKLVAEIPCRLLVDKGDHAWLVFAQLLLTASEDRKALRDIVALTSHLGEDISNTIPSLRISGLKYSIM